MPQRYVIVAVTAVAAMWMYIDRVCFSTLADPIKADLLLPLAPEPAAADGLSAEDIREAKKKKRVADPAAGDAELTPAEVVALQKKKWADGRMSFALGAFFLTYALFQIPMGSLADRYGARRVLAVSIAAWSLVTALTGFVGGFAALLGVRLLLGVTEAGAYPAAAGLVKRWAHPDERGKFSSAVALGGRLGGASAPKLTAWLAVALGGLTFWAAGPSGANWRGVFTLYGACGLLVAGLFYLVVRDHPPGAAPPAAGTPSAPARGFFGRLGVMTRSRNMWFLGAQQFGANVGWAFLITLMPTYLNEAFGVPLEERGMMQSVALYVGCVGMAVGGFTTDYLRQKLGPRLSRSLPVGVTLILCAGLMLVVPGLPTPWAVVGVLAGMAFLIDLHNPSTWAFAQDVGGRNVGAALGWGNMCGNLGAALSPVLLTAVRVRFGWDVVFVTAGVAFLLAGVCGLRLDATKPLEED